MSKPDLAESPVPLTSARALADRNVGTFRFWFVGQRWEWSDEVSRMHGYEPGAVLPTTELLLAHKHPDDRQHVQDLLDHALHFGGSFSSRHRFIDTGGRVHTVIVLADRMFDEGGAVVGTEGYYIDLTDTFAQTRRQALDDSLPQLLEARAAIEQAKGALMLVYGIDADEAFELLMWRSQHTNTKLRALAAQVVAELGTVDAPDNLRQQFDHLLLTAHDRIGTSGPEQPGERGDTRITTEIS
jgi:ANTAR domain/PAS fold